MQTLSKERISMFTASEGHKLFTGGATRKTYIFKKAEEAVKGHSKGFSNKHTDHGHMHEHEAGVNFSEVTGLNVEPCLQKFYRINENSGATPDFTVRNFSDIITASMDCKCPTESFFEQKMIFIEQSKPQFQNVPKEMFYQGQWQMMALSEYNKSIGHPPVTEHYLVRYLASMDIDFDGNQIEYDLPLETRLFYQKIVADERVQKQILYLVEEAAKERDLLVKIFLKPIF
ncbi:MAG: YqaJ viral recombinase family protein [Bacteroidota bacterium]